MPNLSTTYLGLPVRSPVVIAASSLTGRIDPVCKAEEAEAGAVVIRSLFEEQLLLERMQFEEDLQVGAESFPEATSYYPEIEYGDAKEHLVFIEKLRKKVDMPLIGSLNAASGGSWVDYAVKLEEAGVDALELNIYSVETDPERSSAQIEETLFSVYEQVRDRLGIPVSLKLGYFYTAFANVAARLDGMGVNGLVLFNRFLQPDIDLTREMVRNEMPLSSREEMRIPLRWTGLLYGRIKADIAMNTGIQNGDDLIKALLAGARVVQVAGTLIRNGVPYLSTMLRTLERWMEEHGHESLDDFRGDMSQKNVDDPLAYERAQYVGLLLSKGR